MANAARGEVELIIDGRARVLCLTLGALAEIESSFGVAGLNKLGEKLSTPTAEDLLVLVKALLKGGGEGASLEELRTARIDLTDAARAVGDAFALVAAIRAARTEGDG